MQNLTDWIRAVLIVYLLMLVLLYFSAGESYKKFIRFFMGLVLALTVLRPFLSLTGKTGTFSDSVTYEAYRKKVQQAQQDFGRMEQTEAARYSAYYGRAIEEQWLAQAAEQKLEIAEISVTLNEDYSPKTVVIREGADGDGAAFCAYLIAVYGFEEGQVRVE